MFTCLEFIFSINVLLVIQEINLLWIWFQERAWLRNIAFHGLELIDIGNLESVTITNGQLSAQALQLILHTVQLVVFLLLDSDFWVLILFLLVAVLLLLVLIIILVVACRT